MGDPTGDPDALNNWNVIAAGVALAFAYATPVSKPDVVSTKIDCLVTVFAEGTPASAKRAPFTNSENRAVPRTSASAVIVAKPTPNVPDAVDTNLRVSPPATVKGTVFPLPTGAPLASTKPTLNAVSVDVVSLMVPV